MIQESQLLKQSEYDDYKEVFKNSKILREIEVERGINIAKETHIHNTKMAIITTKDDNGEQFDQLTIKYLYYGENLQVLLEELRNKKGGTQLIEKLWEYKEEANQFLHKKLVNGRIVYTTMIEEGYTKPNELPELKGINNNEKDSVQTSGIEDLHSCTASGSCCKFGSTEYNHCGKYCGDRICGGRKPY
ncbi:hypothetical protein [Gracilibacillus salinarum]|uniref:Uncharacterized protein n=1 Tax=Gracilibacillus salinarum TaxID=2932255 RepID=A0ABY4GJE9_9BACI|nr:hypothetical protein [Gracilibacillus salinarum]UOQ84329.1 hypothetical protein MUN87_16775 [Gracilibacillus salinarum]